MFLDIFVFYDIKTLYILIMPCPDATDYQRTQCQVQCLLACFLMTCSAYFLIESSSTGLRMLLPTMKCAQLSQSSIKKMHHRGVYRPILCKHFLTEDYCFSDISLATVKLAQNQSIHVGILSLLFNVPQDHLPRSGTTHNGLGLPAFIINLGNTQ